MMSNTVGWFQTTSEFGGSDVLAWRQGPVDLIGSTGPRRPDQKVDTFNSGSG